MIKYFFGEDSFRLRAIVTKELLEAKVEESYSFSEGELQGFLMSLKSQSFFSTKRAFLVTGILGGLKEKEKQELSGALETMDKDTVIYFEEKKEPPKFIKDLKPEIKAFEILKGHNLVSYIKERVAENGGDIAPLAAERLAGFVGSDLWQLEEEIKKLVLYKKGGPEVRPIETADVDLLVHANFEANIFNLVDAIATRNTRKAEKLLSEFVAEGENPLYLLSMITRQFRNIAMAKFEELSKEAFAKKAGIHLFVAQKTKEQAKNFSPLEIEKIYEKLVAADLSLKSGSEPGAVLQSIIL